MRTKTKDKVGSCHPQTAQQCTDDLPPLQVDCYSKLWQCFVHHFLSQEVETRKTSPSDLNQYERLLGEVPNTHVSFELQPLSTDHIPFLSHGQDHPWFPGAISVLLDQDSDRSISLINLLSWVHTDQTPALIQSDLTQWQRLL